jgi:hypothetical protein
MTIALHWGDTTNRPEDPSGFIYFDAITLYTRDFKGQVTKHPIDGGGNITDHFIKENPVFSLSGVISGADISATPSLLRNLVGLAPTNANPQPNEISVNSGTSGLLKFIPDSIGQFLTVGNPELQFDTTSIRVDWTESVEAQLINIMEGIKFNEATSRFDSFIQTVELYEFNENKVIAKITPNLVMTSFRVREDINTGDGLFFDITLEQVTFATLERAELPQDVVDSMKKKVVPPTKKGKKDSTVKDCASAQAGGDTSAPSTPASSLPSADQDPLRTD